MVIIYFVLSIRSVQHNPFFLELWLSLERDDGFF